MNRCKGDSHTPLSQDINTCVREPRYECMRERPKISIRHVTRVNKSRHIYERSHVKLMNEPCDAYE